MNEQVKKKWLEALRSGEYRQTKDVLLKTSRYGNDSFCCLGVLSELHAQETGGVWEGEEYLGEGQMLAPKVCEWADLEDGGIMDVIGMNDDGASFKKIAKYVEKEF